MSIRALILIVSALTCSAGCLGSYGLDSDTDGGVNGGGDGGGNGGADLAPAVDVFADFVKNVAPILGGPDGKTGACGVCHSVSGGVGPGFLEAKPDMLTTMLGYPGMIGNSPETSRIYAKGTHEGPALSAEQKPVLFTWINEWNVFKPKTMDGGITKPIVAPFAVVIGANTVDLSVLDPMLAGVSITFTAKTLGTSLELQQMTIKTSPSMGVHMVHPLFVLWDAQYNATPDPVDSFSNLDQTVFQMDAKPMGPGTLLLPNYTDQKLSVVFTVIEPKTGSTDGGTVSGCKALANFVANVKPLLQANCNNCHVGANPTASLSFDFGRNTDAQVCANALTEINTTTPASSLLLTKPDPAVANGHPQKIATFGPYRTAVTNWINLEK